MSLFDFHIVLGIMIFLAVVVFISLYYVKAGYGIFHSPSWGPSISNKVAWVCMEAPVFIVMLLMWFFSERCLEPTCVVLLVLFELHYFQRSFVFPLLMHGKSKMPLSIMAMGIIFNLINGFIQGEWIFYLSPKDMYTIQWLLSPWFIVGTVVFFIGMVINCHSDYVIRSLRKPGDTKHYLPQKGMYRYVTSANYLGEIVEWAGWAILTCSLSGLVFLLWTFANLVPRSNAVWHRYKEQFGSSVGSRKRVFPFIY